MDKSLSNYEIKRINRSNIYRLFFENDRLTRRDVVMQLGLSLPTVTQNLTELMEAGLIVRSGNVSNTGGRNANTYSCAQTVRTAIGMDITKHHVTAVAVDLRGNIIGAQRRRICFEQTDAYYRALREIVDRLIEECALEREHVLGVGLGVPGLITEDNRTVFYGEILKFTNATVQDFSRYLDLPARLFNDAKAACFAETWMAGGAPNSFYIMLSNNVGGAMKLNGAMYSGDNRHACEIGHIAIHQDGRPCYCGQRGCVDAYCSAPVLTELSDGTLEDFFARLDAGEPAAVERWETYADDLAQAVKAVRTLFDSDIILGGYVGACMEKYIGAFRAKVARLTTFDRDADYIHVCRYKNEAIAAGAALNFVAEFVSSI